MSNTKVRHVLQHDSTLCSSSSLGGPSLLDALNKDEALLANGNAKTGLKEMGTLFSYLEVYNVIDKVRSSHTT